MWRALLDPTLVSLRQNPIALTLVLLTGALMAMWSSFAAIGLRTRFRKLDLVGFAATAACVPFVLALREGMADCHSSRLHPAYSIRKSNAAGDARLGGLSAVPHQS